MTTLKRLGCAMALTLALSSFIYAGDGQCPAPPPAGPSQVTIIGDQNDDGLETGDQSAEGNSVYNFFASIWESIDSIF